jgi:hypothetical protein
VASLPLTSSWPAKLRLDKDGRGEARLFPATKVTYDKAKRTIDVENYETSLVQRMDVQRPSSLAPSSLVRRFGEAPHEVHPHLRDGPGTDLHLAREGDVPVPVDLDLVVTRCQPQVVR